MSIDYTSYTDEETELFDSIEENEIEEHSEDLTTMMGKVYNAKKVYLRQDASKDSSPVTVLNEDEEVMIDGAVDDDFGNGWYHLITAKSNEGYAMSEFIKIVE